MPASDFQKIFEALPGLFMILSPDLGIIAVTDAYAAATKTQRDEILGKGIFEVFPDNPDDDEATGTGNLRASLMRVLAHKKPDVMAIQKYDIRRPDSEGGGFEERYWAPVNLPVLSETGEVLYIIHKAEDVTEFVKLKNAGLVQQQTMTRLQSDAEQTEKMRQAQRMEAMGQLAGGVAHDFNNMLAVILLNGEMAISDQHIAPETSEAIRQILETAQRAATMTRQLLAFSRRQVLQPKILDLNALMMNIEPMLRRLLPADIEFVTELHSPLRNILADSGQIEQILLNLVVNARDAMPSGGSITVETGNATLDKMMAAGNPKTSPGEYVMLSVRDTGMGMSAETQARIFEPFFTTKATGKGTGLGLATVFGIVSQCAGTLWCYSEQGKGTTFKVYLPVIDEALTSADEPALEMHPERGTARILIAEDQDALRKLMQSTLQLRGYEVMTAANGVLALEILESGKFKPDLLITDVVMPEMTGSNLVTKARMHHKELRVLYVSGYAPESLTNYGISQNDTHFLEKPFSLNALLQKISTALGSPQ